MSLIDIREKKRELRIKHRKIRRSCPSDLKCNLDKKLAESFLSLSEYKACSVVFAFVSSPIEVDTNYIISTALSDGKRVAVPRCIDRFGQMDFYYIDSFTQLKKGMYGIYEPGEDCELVMNNIDDGLGKSICLVPGLSFDMNGYRLGFGKGYYDRFLDDFNGIKIGICYSKCMEKQLPTGAFDKPVDIIITEKYISRIGSPLG